MSITIELTPEVEKWLATKIDLSVVSSASEFVNATLSRDLLEEQLEEALREPATELTKEDWESARRRLQQSLSK